jgi:transposase
MQRIFRPYDYDATLDHTLRVGDVLPPTHEARCLVEFLATLDLSALYALYYPIGPHPYDPRVMLALWLYGYMTGVRSSRQLERAIHERIPFYYLAAGSTPDHSALAEFRTLVLAYSPTLFQDVLTQAKQEQDLTLKTVSHDGTKIHADASKHQAVSYKRAGELIVELQAQSDNLLCRAQHAPASLPAAMNLSDEIAMRCDRIHRLQAARKVLEARAEARYHAELAAYEAKMDARAEGARLAGKQPGGKPPTPPTPGARPKDQMNFTDPESHIMKNSTNSGFDQHYNAQITVDHGSRLIVGCYLSNHATDTQEAVPTFDTIPAAVGTPEVACLDHGFWNPTTVETLIARGITPYIAVGKTVHGLNWERYFATTPTTPPPPDASPVIHMAYQQQTAEGQAIYRERKSTVEPVIGIIKEILGFRQFSLRGREKALGEWRLVCSAYNLKRIFKLRANKSLEQAQGQATTAPFVPNMALFRCLPPGSQPRHGGMWLWNQISAIAIYTKPTARRLATGC